MTNLTSREHPGSGPTEDSGHAPEIPSNSPKEEWQTLGFTCTTFGDLVAGLLLAEALEMAKALADQSAKEQDEQTAATLKLEASQLEETARQIEKYVYVDDAALGGSKSLVDSKIGEPEEGR